MKRTTFVAVSAVVLGLLAPIAALAAEASAMPADHQVFNPAVLVGFAAVLIAAKLGGELFERFGQPAVLGELCAGIAIGALALFGLDTIEFLRNNEILAALAEIGVIVLLFEVGLESNIGDMMKVGWSSLLVACAGVIAPFLLGWIAAVYFLPESPTLTHMFVAATLCATSVGITARVLRDLGRLSTRESRIVLGAAVIDDVLGLLILAVIGGAINAARTGVALGGLEIALIAAKAAIFLVGSILVGQYVMPHVFRRAGRLERRGVLLALSFSFCFAMAWLASAVGLAPIVGAFAAGLVLDEVHFETFRTHEDRTLDQLIAPVSSLLVPIFFVLMGLKVDLTFLLRPEILLFAGVLTLVAVVGKQVCAFAAVERGVNRLQIGLGMIPRGEVGLIMAGIGAKLALPNASGVMEPVIAPSTFGAIVVMVIVTTLVTPMLLKWSMNEAVETTAADASAMSGTLIELPE